PAKVVGDDVGARQSPMPQQRGEHLVLHSKRDVLAVALLGLTVAQKVEQEDLPRARELTSDAPPDVRGEGRAVHQHDRLALAQDIVGHGLAAMIEPSRERPLDGHPTSPCPEWERPGPSLWQPSPGLKPASKLRGRRVSRTRFGACGSTDEADADGPTGFYGLQAMVGRAMFEAGECCFGSDPGASR